MRLSAKEVTFTVGAVPNPLRPIRLRGGGLTYCLSTTEAVELANQLADAVSEAKQQTTKPKALDFFNTNERNNTHE